MSEEKLVNVKQSALVMRWIELVYKTGEYGVEIPLTRKQRGQLKMLADKLGPDTVRVLEFVLGKWMSFAQAASRDAGLRSHPLSPHVGFLLAHYPWAVRCLHEEEKTEQRSLQIKEEATATQLAREKQLEEQNVRSIEMMRKAFEEAGEPMPQIEYLKTGEVIHKLTMKQVLGLQTTDLSHFAP